jgi:hypothetical protein
VSFGGFLGLVSTLGTLAAMIAAIVGKLRLRTAIGIQFAIYFVIGLILPIFGLEKPVDTVQVVSTLFLIAAGTTIVIVFLVRWALAW